MRNPSNSMSGGARDGSIHPSQERATGPRILFDCTATLRDRYETGIQRVVRNLARSGPAAGRELGIECEPVVHLVGGWYLPTASYLARIDSYRGEFLSPSPQGVARRLLLSGRRRLRQALVPRPVFNWTMDNYRRLARRFQCHRLQINPGDILLLPDVGWGEQNMQPLAAARRQGATIGLVSYDLIPLKYPQYQAPEFPRVFEKWLRDTLPQVDFCVGISRAVSGELQEFIDSEGDRYSHLRDCVGWFPLGMSLDKADANMEIRPDLREFFERENASAPFLIVCTLEPRKNHALLLDAFDQLRRLCPETRLCVVGRAGWLCDDMVARLRSHPVWKQRLLWTGELNDAELDYCYRHSRAFVFPSFAEGFGLPIVEALRYGLPVLASDIPVHREIGGEFCHFFDPSSTDQLLQLMLACLGRSALPTVRPAHEFRPTSWADASGALWRECLRLAELSRTSARTRPNDPGCLEQVDRRVA